MCDAKPNLSREIHDCVLWRLVRAFIFSIHLSPEENLKIHEKVPKDFGTVHRVILNVSEGITIYVDSETPYCNDRKRPDILFVDENRKKAIIVDVSIAVEESSFAFDNAREERIQRYSDPKNALERKVSRHSCMHICWARLARLMPKTLLSSMSYRSRRYT